jgi:hypothetical protein
LVRVGAHGCLGEGAADPGTALAGGAGLLRPAGCSARGANLAQEARWPGVEEAGHVLPDLGDEFLRAGAADAGDLIELGHPAGERGQCLVDPDGQLVDLAVSASIRSSIMASR